MHSKANNIQGVPRYLDRIRRFWWDLFNLTSSPDFEEAVFQVYLQMGTSKITRIEPDEASLRQCVAETSKQFQGFHAAAQLTTGLSMELLWNICRRAAVPTMERLTSLVQLERLADQFDLAAWQIKAPMEELYEIRKSIASTLIITRNQDVDVKTLIEVSSSFGCHYFHVINPA